MPFMSYHKGEDEAIYNAGRFMQDSLAEAVKVEGGKSICPLVERLVDAGIPVIGHIGLRPQSILVYGTYRARGSEEDEAKLIIEEAQALQDAGAFGVVVEKVPSELAKRITEAVKIPTIGIGAGPDCDGQILVTTDMLGMYTRFRPRFVRRYAELATEMSQAFQQYRADVKSLSFPNESESY